MGDRSATQRQTPRLASVGAARGPPGPSHPNKGRVCVIDGRKKAPRIWYWLAFAGWLLFALLAFGVRPLVQLRRTGSTGFRGISGRGLERLGGVLFAVAVVASALTPLAALADWIEPAESLLELRWQLAGVALYALGLAGALWAQWAMGVSWRIGVDPSERTELVTAGPFRWVRNPIFTALLLISGKNLDHFSTKTGPGAGPILVEKRLAIVPEAPTATRRSGRCVARRRSGPSLP